MKYFCMGQGKRILHQVVLEAFPTEERVNFTKEDAEKLAESTMLYTIEDENSVYPDILEAPLYMVSETISHVVTMYDPTVITKRVSLVNRERKSLQKYQLLLLDQIDCLHETSEFYPDKTVKRLILDKEKVKGQEIFQIAGVDRMDVIVSLNIAESVLRRNVFGVQFQEICCN